MKKTAKLNLSWKRAVRPTPGTARPTTPMSTAENSTGDGLQSIARSRRHSASAKTAGPVAQGNPACGRFDPDQPQRLCSGRRLRRAAFQPGQQPSSNAFHPSRYKKPFAWPPVAQAFSLCAFFNPANTRLDELTDPRTVTPFPQSPRPLQPPFSTPRLTSRSDGLHPTNPILVFPKSGIENYQ
jgi:hypothetical protein